MELVFNLDFDLDSTKVFLMTEANGKEYRRKLDHRIKDYDNCVKDAISKIVIYLERQGLLIDNVVCDIIGMG